MLEIILINLAKIISGIILIGILLYIYSRIASIAWHRTRSEFERSNRIYPTNTRKYPAKKKEES